jgi:peptidoglycan/LPS O-acetylase OafA/YrhL
LIKSFRPFGPQRSARRIPATAQKLQSGLLKMDMLSLTFLRFIAALGAVLFHVGPHITWLGPGEHIVRHSNTGVSFFFVLSGFILAVVYTQRPLRHDDFFVARAARLLPLYWLALAVPTALDTARGVLDPVEFVLSALLLQAWWPPAALALNLPGWSLSVEAFFYLCFPLLMKRLGDLSTRGLLAVLFGSWAANLLLHVVLVQAAERTGSMELNAFAYYHPLVHLPTFVAGVSAGLIFARHPDRVAAYSPALVAGSVLVLAVMLSVPNPVVRYHHNGLFAPVFVALIWGVGSRPASALSRGLAARPLVRLGEASYGIYLLHYPLHKVYEIAVGYTWGYELHYAVWFGGVLSIALVVHRFVEAPLREWIRRSYASPRAADA